MDINITTSMIAAGAAIAAAVASLVALPFTARAANAAYQQTGLQLQTARQSSQPYVWADIRVNESTGWTLSFIVGNAGPTVATDVTITIEPALPVGGDNAHLTERAFERLKDGVKSIGPGRVLSWTLGPSPELLTDDRPQPFTIVIDGNGPYGPISTLSYVIDLADYRESLAAPPGVLAPADQGSEGHREEAVTKRPGVAVLGVALSRRGPR